jgi:hypothetical protein
MAPTIVCRSLLAVILLLLSASSFLAQKAGEQWIRVFTGDDSHIELNLDTITFHPDRSIRAQFRTVYLTPEPVDAKSDLKYKTRLEEIGFKLSGKQFRLFEVRLLDANSNVLKKALTTSEEDWRVLKEGGMMARLFRTLSELPPFGAWETVAYRFADDVVDRTTGERDLESLIGNRVQFSPENVRVGLKSCPSPTFESLTLAAEELSKEFGIKARPVGLNSKTIDTITVKCSAAGWPPDSRSFLLRSPEGKLLMLWNGVFLVLKRDRLSTPDRASLLRTRQLTQ